MQVGSWLSLQGRGWDPGLTQQKIGTRHVTGPPQGCLLELMSPCQEALTSCKVGSTPFLVFTALKASDCPACGICLHPSCREGWRRELGFHFGEEQLLQTELCSPHQIHMLKP